MTKNIRCTFTSINHRNGEILQWSWSCLPQHSQNPLPQHSQNPTRTNRSSGLIRNSHLLNKQMIIDNSCLGLARLWCKDLIPGIWKSDIMGEWGQVPQLSWCWCQTWVSEVKSHSYLGVGVKLGWVRSSPTVILVLMSNLGEWGQVPQLSWCWCQTCVQLSRGFGIRVSITLVWH
jgi:hypothetical protein